MILNLLIAITIVVSTEAGGGSGEGSGNVPGNGNNQLASVMNIVKSNIPKVQSVCKYSQSTVSQVKSLADGLVNKHSCQSLWAKLVHIIQVTLNCKADSGTLASIATNKASLGLLGLLPVIGSSGSTSGNVMGLLSSLGGLQQGSKQSSTLGTVSSLLTSAVAQPQPGSKQPKPSGTQGDVASLLTTLGSQVNHFKTDQSSGTKTQLLSTLEKVVTNCQKNQFKGCC